MQPLRGLVLLAHGARDPSWAVPFESVVARVRAQTPATEVRLAFLELMSPRLEGAAEELRALGCARIDVVPLFLGMGGHVRRDVPAQLAALREAHPGVDWRLHDAVGERPSVIAALADAALALACADDGDGPSVGAIGAIGAMASIPPAVSADAPPVDDPGGPR